MERWRMALLAAGLALGLPPLAYGEWGGAVFTAVAGLFVVGAWALPTRCGPVAGSVVGGCLVAALAAAYAVSQWPREDLLRPPASDYIVAWAAVGAAAPLALLVEAVLAGNMRAGGALMIVLAAALPAAGCVYVAPLLDEDFATWRFLALDREILPLPGTLRLVSDRRCAGSGSSGNCTAEFVVTAADGGGVDVVRGRLVDHLSRIGWPVTKTDDHATLDVGGILPWTPHSLWLSDEVTSLGPPAPAGAVVVYIDNG